MRTDSRIDMHIGLRVHMASVLDARQHPQPQMDGDLDLCIDMCRDMCMDVSRHV